jgi:tetratricopeptide (TPR) repeat protein
VAGVLWHLWELRSAFTDGRRRLVAVLALPGADTPTLVRARALNGAGVLALNQYDIAAARGLFRDSLVLYRHQQHAPGVAWVLMHLSWLCIDIGRFRPTRRFLNEALTLCEQLGDQRGIARSLDLLGYLAWGEGDLAASRDFHLRALSLNRELDYGWGSAWSLERLSTTLLNLAERGEGRTSDVRPLIDEALIIWRELGERRLFAFALCGLGTVAILEQDFDQGHRWLMQGLSIFLELADPHGAGWVLVAQELLLATAGDFESALRVRGALVSVLRPFEGHSRSPDRLPVPILERFERHKAQAEERHGAEVIAKALTEGEAMSLSEAIAYAQSACATAAHKTGLGRDPVQSAPRSGQAEASRR